MTLDELKEVLIQSATENQEERDDDELPSVVTNAFGTPRKRCKAEEQPRGLRQILELAKVEPAGDTSQCSICLDAPEVNKMILLSNAVTDSCTGSSSYELQALFLPRSVWCIPLNETDVRSNGLIYIECRMYRKRDSKRRCTRHRKSVSSMQRSGRNGKFESICSRVWGPVRRH